jgi:hypothetical protein
MKSVGNPPRSFLPQATPPLHNKYPNNWQHFFWILQCGGIFIMSPHLCKKKQIEIVVKGLISQVQSQESLLKKLTIFIAEIS